MVVANAGGGAGPTPASGGGPSMVRVTASGGSSVASGGAASGGVAPSSGGSASGGATSSGGNGGASGAPPADAGTSGDGGRKVCSGKPGLKKGKSSQTVTARTPRTFVYYAPPSLEPNVAVPLVIVPHGYTETGQDMYDITRYKDIADREGFVVAFPDGAPGSIGPWDVGTGVCGLGASVPGSGDDQGFVDAMIAFADADRCIDHDHIFMTGWSMGGYLSNHTGCLRKDIRAIGPHSAGSHDLGSCPVAHKPVILFHFNPDGLIDYKCGVEARDRWVKRNGCSSDAPDVKMVKGGRCEYYRGCAEDGQVAFCTFDVPANHAADFLSGHAWSGGTVHAYSIAETESAAELGWAFFKKYAW